jgi:hypothetical protein
MQGISGSLLIAGNFWIYVNAGNLWIYVMLEISGSIVCWESVYLCNALTQSVKTVLLSPRNKQKTAMPLGGL